MKSSRKIPRWLAGKEEKRKELWNLFGLAEAKDGSNKPGRDGNSDGKPEVIAQFFEHTHHGYGHETNSAKDKDIQNQIQQAFEELLAPILAGYGHASAEEVRGGCKTKKKKNSKTR